MMSEEKIQPSLSIGSITNNGGNNTVTGDIDAKTDASIQVSGDVSGGISQNFGGGTVPPEEFFSKLIDAVLDAADVNNVEYDEAEVTDIVNQLNDSASSESTPSPEDITTLETKWQSLLRKFGPTVAQVALAAVQAIPVAGPVAAVVISMVTKSLELAAQAAAR